jgi:predicted PhzF superfamily epimerase YddE/YHI9
MVNASGAYRSGSLHAFDLRSLAPGVGVSDDPVCGSMNTSVAQWLTGTGAAPNTYKSSRARGLAGQETSPDRRLRGTVWVGDARTTCFGGILAL